MVRLTPADYRMQVVSPFERSVQGYQAGFGQMQQLNEVRRQRVADQQAAQLHDAQLAYTQAQTSALEQERQKAQQREAALAALMQKETDGTATAEDWNTYSLQFGDELSAEYAQRIQDAQDLEIASALFAESQTVFNLSNDPNGGALINDYLNRKIAATQDPQLKAELTSQLSAFNMLEDLNPGMGLVSVRAQASQTMSMLGGQHATLNEQWKTLRPGSPEPRKMSSAYLAALNEILGPVTATEAQKLINEDPALAARISQRAAEIENASGSGVNVTVGDMSLFAGRNQPVDQQSQQPAPTSQQPTSLPTALPGQTTSASDTLEQIQSTPSVETPSDNEGFPVLAVDADYRNAYSVTQDRNGNVRVSPTPGSVDFRAETDRQKTTLNNFITRSGTLFEAVKSGRRLVDANLLIDPENPSQAAGIREFFNIQQAEAEFRPRLQPYLPDIANLEKLEAATTFATQQSIGLGTKAFDTEKEVERFRALNPMDNFTSLVNTVIGLDLLASGGEVGIELLNEGVITPEQYIDAVQQGVSQARAQLDDGARRRQALIAENPGLYTQDELERLNAGRAAYVENVQAKINRALAAVDSVERALNQNGAGIVRLAPLPQDSNNFTLMPGITFPDGSVGSARIEVHPPYRVFNNQAEVKGYFNPETSLIQREPLNAAQ